MIMIMILLLVLRSFPYSTSVRRANVGMALGNLGVDVCKRSADMLIADDSFASVVCAVEEGRLIFDNLRKATAYTITNKVPEAVAFLLFLIAEIPIAISTLTILYLDIIVDLVRQPYIISFHCLTLLTDTQAHSSTVLYMAVRHTRIIPDPIRYILTYLISSHDVTCNNNS